MKKSFFAVILIIFVACQTTNIPVSDTTKVLGTLQIEFDLDKKQTHIVWRSNRVMPQAVQTTNQLSLTPNGLPLGFVSDAATNTDFVSAKFNVSNLTSNALTDVTLVAYQKTGNQSDTAIRDVVNFVGGSLSLQTFARNIKPVNMVNGSLALDAGNEDLQFFTEAEISSLQTQAVSANEISIASGEYLFPYGYVVRATGSSNSRLLAAGSNTGTLNIAIRIPNNNPAPNNSVRRFSMTFVAFDAPVVSRVSESLEEQAGSGAVARASSFGTPRVAALRNSALHTTTDGTKVNVCQVRTAGSTTTPLAYLDTSSLVTTSGSRDTCFATGGKRVFVDVGYALGDRKLVRQSDGKFVISGVAKNGTQTDFSIIRYLPDGSLDSSFGINGQVITDFNGTDDLVSAIALDNSQKIIAVGRSDSTFAVARYNSNGTLDTTFDSDGKLTTPVGVSAGALAVAIDSTNKIVVAGGSSLGYTVVKYNTSGSLDTGFDGDGIFTTGSGAILDTFFTVMVDASDRIVAGGFPTASPTTAAFKIMRILSNGTLDTSFNTTGIVVGEIRTLYGMTFDQQGKILVAGGEQNASQNNDYVVSRYTANGSLDTTFDGDGKVFVDFAGLNDFGVVICVDSNSKILVGGTINTSTNAQRSGIARLNTDGSLDTTFANNGLLTEAQFTTPASINAVDTGALSVSSMLVTPTGKITALGYFLTSAPASGYYPGNLILLQYNP